MRLSNRKSIFALASFGLLGLVAAFVWLGNPGTINAQAPPFIVEGKVIINGNPAGEGSSIIAYIDGRDVAEAKILGGTFTMAIPEQPGQNLAGRAIEFAGRAPDGGLFDFAQKAVWSPGGRADIRLELNTDSSFGDSGPTEFDSPFIVQGKVIINGNIPPDGSLIAAFIFGSRIPEAADVDGGRFELEIPQTDGPRFDSQIVEFQALFPDGRHIDFPQTVRWQAGGFTNVALEIGQFREPFEPRERREPVEPSAPFGLPGISVPQLPEGLDIGCAMRILGRIPSSLQDMSPQENFRVTQECFSGGGRDDSSRIELERLQIEQEKQRLEQELAFQREQQRLDADRIRQEREFQQEQQRLETQRLQQDRALQEEQQRLDQERRTREQERIKREQALQAEQDRLDRDRLKSERERQEEQARLDSERLKQEQERFQAEQGMQIEQQRLDQRRALEEQQRQDELEKARFESERARIDRERALEEERARLDQERLKRDDERMRLEAQLNQNRPGQGPGGNPPGTGTLGNPPVDVRASTGPTRGFFTNSQIGQLGSVNQLLDPATLAVIGILITLAATTLQLFKGN